MPDARDHGTGRARWAFPRALGVLLALVLTSSLASCGASSPGRRVADDQELHQRPRASRASAARRDW